MIRLIVTLAMTLALVFTAAPANADTKFRADRYNASIPAQNLKNTTFKYAHHAKYRVKVESLSKRKTMVVAKFSRPGYSITVGTKFVNGKKRTTGWKQMNRAPYDRYRLPAVRASWNFKTDVVRFVIPRRYIGGPRAQMSAWTQYKGANHGNYQGDGTYARVRRF